MSPTVGSSKDSYEARIKRAYRLYVQYKTTTQEYRELAQSFNISPLGLNAQLNGVHNARLRARAIRRKLKK